MKWLSRELGHRDVVGDGDDIPIITIISMFLFFNSLSHDNRKTANPYAVTTVTITIVRKRRKKRPRFWEVPIDLCRR